MTIWTTSARSSGAFSRSNGGNNSEAVTLNAPVGVPDSFDEHVELMFDLVAAAYQADVTRVFTFMMSRELSQRTYPQIGVTEQHHSVSHHQNNAEKMAKVVMINMYYVGLFAKFLEKLRATEDGDGSLLDHSLVLLWRGHGRFEFPCVRSFADRCHRRRRRQRTSARSRSLRGHRWVVCGPRWRIVSARHMERFGDGAGMIDGIF